MKLLSLRGFSLRRLALLLVTVAPLLAWAVVKPVRVLAPEWAAGVRCVPGAPVCTDDPARLDEARRLYADALTFVDGHVGDLERAPRFVFCATTQCAEAFGLGARAAVTLGTAGTVIAPRGWQPWFVRHELIHVLQAQNLGVLPLLRKPAWFVEGMAYGLSEDPRQPLAEPFESERRAFQAWYARVGHDALWREAAGL